jgi:hypothetical protein
MAEKLKVCLWPTTLQANIYSIARHLASRPDQFDTCTVVDGLESYRREPIFELAPVGGTLLDRAAPDLKARLTQFAADVLVVDNHHPPFPVAPGLVNVWHGFGWRGPEDRESFAQVFADVRKHTGQPADEPNPCFRWITAGPTNFEHRVRITGFHPDNVLPLGQAFIDDVLKFNLGRAQLERFYPDAFRGRKIALFAPTWHFGRIFSHWGDDFEILERVFSHLAREGAALIMRMHDRKRFDPQYLGQLEQLAARHAHVLLKYKDGNQDNLLDIAISDVMLSNYSSILTYFYATGRPSIHMQPVAPGAQDSVYRYWKHGKVQTKKAGASYIWSLDPDQIGGLFVDSVSGLEAALSRALREPTCCQEPSRAFVESHCAAYDGHTCERIAQAIRDVGDRARAEPRKRGLLGALFG